MRRIRVEMRQIRWECKYGESAWECEEFRWKLKYTGRNDRIAMEMLKVKIIENEHICKTFVSHI